MTGAESGHEAVAETPALQRGARFDASDATAFLGALRAIVDYRGDVTITRQSTPEPIAGYVYDCTEAQDPERAALRLLPAAGGGRLTVPVADLVAIEITGRDTAEGKSFETWVRKYVERKRAEAAGEATGGAT